jgi:hypothetical protein
MRTEILLERAPQVRDSRIVIVSTQDVEPILERNKALRGEPQRGHDCARLVADIPAVILVRWLNEEYARGNTHLRLFTREFNDTVVRRKLQDPEWRYLRTDK